MLDQIMELVKGQVAKTVGGIDGIPAGKESAVVETTAASLIGGLKKNATLDGLGALLGGGSKGGAMASSLSKGIVQSLTSKLKLNPALARTIASTVIPAVMSLINKRVADKGEPGFNLESILGGLTGGRAAGTRGSGGGLGGLLGGLGGLFGKK
jgi:hypothetical protein